MALSIRQTDSHEAMSREAVRRILDLLRGNPRLLLCAPTGMTPLRTYELLSEYSAREAALFASLRVLKLDEWGGLDMKDASSCEAQLRKYLIDPLGLTGSRYFGFVSNPHDAEAECKRVHDLVVAEGPIDLCLLGLGVNGHIALNEPSASLQPFAHVAQLAESSLRHPMLTGSRTAPAYGLTLGMAEILASREVLLLVSGASKRDPMKRLLKHEVTADFPASFLWLHPNCTIICDREASAGVEP